ncbi:MAG: GWxTD domain-containing protein, partial [Thermoanaerobaculia bacterium]
MKRTIFSALSLLLLSAVSVLPSLAALVKYKDWEKSPESVYLATDDEKKEWKKVDSDEGAEKFIALFWAKRDPDLKTPQNEYRERFDALVKNADDLFPLGRKRGALTERGKALILIGPPKSIAQKAATSLSQSIEPLAPGAVQGTGMTDNAATTIVTQFLYEKPQLPPWAVVQTLELKFQVDLSLVTEHFVEGMSP